MLMFSAFRAFKTAGHHSYGEARHLWKFKASLEILRNLLGTNKESLCELERPIELHDYITPNNIWHQNTCTESNPILRLAIEERNRREDAQNRTVRAGVTRGAEDLEISFQAMNFRDHDY